MAKVEYDERYLLNGKMANGSSKSAGSSAGPFPATPTPKPPGKAKTTKPKKPVPSPKKWGATIYASNSPLPDGFVAAVREVEAIIKTPVLLLIQDGSVYPPPAFHNLDETVLQGFMASRPTLPHKPAHLILDSPGGQAKCAYQLANLFRVHCGGFTVYVPEWAKSAATLLALGASEIYLGKHAELGPLDVQVFDAEREGFCSALDEVQALERLNAFALQAVDTGMILFRARSMKSLSSLLPPTQHFIAEMLRPLFEKISTVHYTQMSRLLKVSEEYATRLLRPKYPKRKAEEIARHLVHDYPEHGFYIDGKEAAGFDLETKDPPSNLAAALDKVAANMRGLIVVGQLKEMKP